MGYVARSLDSTMMLAALTNDSVKWEGGAVSGGVYDFYSLGAGTIDLTTASGTKTLMNVVLPNISGLTIRAAYLAIYFPILNESSGAVNENVGVSTVQVDKDAAGWISAITLNGNEMKMPANSIQKGLWLYGSIDISSRVAFNATTNVRWANAEAGGNQIRTYSILSRVRVLL